MQQENLVKKYFWDFAAELVNSFLAKSLGVVGGQESYFLFWRLHISTCASKSVWVIERATIRHEDESNFHPRVNILQMILISILHNVTTFKNKYCMTAKLTLELPRINTQCLSTEVF